MHNMCNEANYAKFSGAAVEQDFVEMPSQMLENWMWQPSVLKLISRHYKTGKSLDDKAIQKKIEGKNLHSATETLNQITLATVDLIMNSAYDK
jgi:Zn-dependent oligopeptidase